ncbi:hypothetical protein, partial [Mesorhizobium sp. M2D.F.Ca.ET.153.01.1.1]|uniref:hypothetical protein n=1 Tax=Mesorhizobium sp. M2D.F.Ca.ET.153.01.1.1 TaxID=2500520 RepID=UPI001AEDEDD6
SVSSFGIGRAGYRGRSGDIDPKSRALHELETAGKLQRFGRLPTAGICEALASGAASAAFRRMDAIHAGALPVPRASDRLASVHLRAIDRTDC